ncbi:MAG: hypothetical protein HIU81_11290, partial [Acidobacteria bacterium]|nr:hypothetical protein [Acidobacteriota bacterium]
MCANFAGSIRRGPSATAIEGEGSFVTETTDTLSGVENSTSAAPAKSNGLAGLKLAQLQALAGQLGITGGSRMRKGDLVSAISDHQRGSKVADRAPATASTGSATSKGNAAAPKAAVAASNASAQQAAPAEQSTGAEAPAEGGRGRGRGRSRRAGSAGVVSTDATATAESPVAEA